jgi:hypothetical protein
MTGTAQQREPGLANMARSEVGKAVHSRWRPRSSETSGLSLAGHGKRSQRFRCFGNVFFIERPLIRLDGRNPLKIVMRNRNV